MRFLASNIYIHSYYSKCTYERHGHPNQMATLITLEILHDKQDTILSVLTDIRFRDVSYFFLSAIESLLLGVQFCNTVCNNKTF